MDGYISMKENDMQIKTINKFILALGLLGLMIMSAQNLKAETPSWLSSVAPKVGAALLGVASYCAIQQLGYHLFYKNSKKTSLAIDEKTKKTIAKNKEFLLPDQEKEYREKRNKLKELTNKSNSHFPLGLLGIGAGYAAPLLLGTTEQSPMPFISCASAFIAYMTGMLSTHSALLQEKSAIKSWREEKVAQNKAAALKRQKEQADELERQLPVKSLQEFDTVREFPGLAPDQIKNFGLTEQKKLKELNNKRQIEFETAVAQQRLPDVKRLLEEGVDVNKKIANGETPLIHSIICRNYDLTNILLSSPSIYVNTTSQTDAIPAFAIAAGIGNAKAVKRLLEFKKLALNKKNSEGMTALVIASFNGHSAITKLLLADERIDVDVQDNHKQSALFVAVVRRHLDIIQQLLDAGANPNLASLSGDTPLSIALDGASKKHSDFLINLETFVISQEETPNQFIPIVLALLNDTRTDVEPYLSKIKQMGHEIRQHPRLKGFYEVNSIFEMLKVMP